MSIADIFHSVRVVIVNIIGCLIFHEHQPELKNLGGNAVLLEIQGSFVLYNQVVVFKQ